MPTPTSPRVALFISCLADMFRPSVAFATIELLEAAGCNVEVPAGQTCCGQPGYNAGAGAETKAIARQLITRFENFDYIVTPSGSCAGMLHHHYPLLLKDDAEWSDRADKLAAKCHEITSFLVDVMHYQPAELRRDYSGLKLTYHDSCAGLREMAIKQQPRQLLKSCCNVEVMEMEYTEVCCGFGGTFCAKMPGISGKMASDKLDNAVASGAAMLVGGDLGCLMHLSGRATRLGIPLQVRHVAEVLADRLHSPAIGEGKA